MGKREANFELLRVIAMLMIITLHFLDKGGILPGPSRPGLELTGTLAWLLEAFCVASVNVYVLISAYFLVDTKYRPGRIFSLWMQTFTTSVVIMAIALGSGMVPMEEWDIYSLLPCILPITGEHYWFVTAYLLMFLIAPLMNDGLHRIDERMLRRGILLLLLFFSLAPSALPVDLPTDRMGYDGLWFLALYLIGAYLRLHGEGFWTGRKAMGGFLLCSFLIFGSYLALHIFYDVTGKLGDFMNRQYHYNSVLCLLASVFLFQWFRGIRLRSEPASETVCRLASVSFGVYLIHEHLLLRYLWPKWLRVDLVKATPLFLLYWPVAIAIVYLVCGLLEAGRQKLFARAERAWKKK